MAHEVFISYSSRDKPAADAACHFLEADGIRCWIAPRDIPPGQPWKPSIVQAIREAPVMVLIFSGQANRSPQVKREVDIAFEAGHCIVPFRIEDVQMDDEMYYCLAAAHWLDALSDPIEQHLDRLLHAVRLLVLPDQSAAVLPDQSTASPPSGPSPAPPHRRRWIVPAGIAGLLLGASVAFGLSRTGGLPGPSETESSGPEFVRTSAITEVPGATSEPSAPVPAQPAPSSTATPEPAPAPPVTSAPTAAATGVLVVIYGDDAGSAAQAETTVLGSLLAVPDLHGVDVNSLSLIRGQQSALAAANRGDFTALSALGRAHGVELLVVGTLMSSAAPSVNRFSTGNAELDLKMYRVSTGTLVGAEVIRSGTGGSLAASEAEARSRASRDAGNAAARTVRIWANRTVP